MNAKTETAPALPNLAGVATKELVETLGGGSFKASYINWSRTVNLLREHAAGWQPELVLTEAGDILHRAPIGGFLLIRFVHVAGAVTPSVPQAVMDSHNKAIPFDKITARDVTDTHRRGVCMAAAFTFGLAYELWAKMPLESGFDDGHEEAAPEGSHSTQPGQPMHGVWDGLDDKQRQVIESAAAIVGEYMETGDAQGAYAYLESQAFETEEKAALWSILPSTTRTAFKKLKQEQPA
jgi:hypothetical protein